MDTLQESILKVMTYFDIFQYPLAAEEIRSFMDKPCNEEKLNHVLAELVRDEVLFKTLDFYTLHRNSSYGKKRIKENMTAKTQLRKAKKVAAFLTWFPFIKGIAISGSLSKQVARTDSDIDFFIITKANRLWVSKLFFSALIKCASLVNLDKWFCLNYVIDETNLEVAEKNIFTATEIITLIPLYGSSLFDKFFEINHWIYGFFPNHSEKKFFAKEKAVVLPRKIIEWLFNNNQGDKADNAIMKFFEKRWKKLIEQHKFSKSGFQIGTMTVDKHSCRPYPEHFQQKILDLYDERLNALKTTLRIAI